MIEYVRVCVCERVCEGDERREKREKERRWEGEREGVIGEERKRTRKRKKKMGDEKREKSRVVVGSMGSRCGLLGSHPGPPRLCGLCASPFSSV